MEARLIRELPAIPTKRRNEEWGSYWRRAFDERTSQLTKAAEELAEMTKDRDLWQEAHDDDCPNKAMVDEMRAELARERERHQEAVNKLKRFSDKCGCSTCGVIREAIALLEPAPVATGESK